MIRSKHLLIVSIACFTVSAVLVAVLICGGCSTVTKAISQAEATITGTVVPDVCAAADFYTRYIAGVVGMAGGLIPAAAPFVTLADTAIDVLNTDCKSGALAATIQKDIDKVDKIIQQINDIVGEAKK